MTTAGVDEGVTPTAHATGLAGTCRTGQAVIAGVRVAGRRGWARPGTGAMGAC
jgi:hypothetical protein